MEKDVSVRQQAVDLLYAMCDKSNSEEIVQEMLNYLETADYSIREEMVKFLILFLFYYTVTWKFGVKVLKVAILAEKYATDYTWYVDVILNLIRIAGDYVSEEVWYRVIQIVINRDDVQGYAAKTVFEVFYFIKLIIALTKLMPISLPFWFLLDLYMIFNRHYKLRLVTRIWLKLVGIYLGSLAT